jgi:hypothetical protein
MITTKTSLVYNEPNKLFGLSPFYYRYRSCDTNLTGNTPADQYQRLKLIQNTVRVQSSLYTANLGPLSAYKNANKTPHGVCWNQMSDRPFPSVQTGVIPTGSNSSMNRRHTSVTSSRPGCQAPGGVGCDIKHNSYDRYLNRLKGKGPLRRGIVPPNFGVPIPFNNAYPIYGGKTTKTSIINGCDCSQVNNINIYNNPNWQPDPDGNIEYFVGQFVYAIEYGNNFVSKAKIISIINNIYKIEFENGVEQDVVFNDLKIYFPCNCN